MKTYTKRKHTPTVPVMMWHGGHSDIIREVRTVSYWEGNTLIDRHATPDLVAKLIIKSTYEKSNAIVTDDGHMYLSFDTPGYCDGELTIKKMI